MLAETYPLRVLLMTFSGLVNRGVPLLPLSECDRQSQMGALNRSDARRSNSR